MKMKKLLSLLLAGAMLLTMVPASLAEDAAADARTALVNTLADEAVSYINAGSLSAYSSMSWTSEADTFPAKFDLRDRGVVPAVRNQGAWGNCWSFATIAACEISQLSTLGVTAEQFLEATGMELDLSERHLAWFGTSHLPTVESYAEGEYPYDKSQAGEGTWSLLEETDPNKAHFSGGSLHFASSVFANGVGPESEEDWPYKANDGTNSTAADWSIPEENRYAIEAEMLNSSILPSPAGKDENGAYVYSAAGTEAIKEELLAGRGVSIQFHADQNMSPEAAYKLRVDIYMANGFPQEHAEVLAGLESHYLDPEDMTQAQKENLMYVYLLINGTPADQITQEMIDQAMAENYDAFVDRLVNPKAQADQTAGMTAEEQTAAEAQQRALYEQLGIDYEKDQQETALRTAANAVSYINPETYAQYVDNEYATPDHGVTIVGWDDSYAVSNFLADHQPPAPGAWICRNSWGEDYGDGGYFYLSYYDRSISFVETFEFVFDSNAMNGVGIDAYDHMEAAAISSVEMEQTVSMANVFPMEQECVLSYVSVLTTELNALVTANVYLLNENYTSPTDGVLLETVTQECKYAGYHRISLDYDYQLPAGSVISVVERQRVDTDNGTRYNLSYTNGLNKTFVELTGATTSWSEGIINQGESFVGVDGQWFDWADIVTDVKSARMAASLLAYDNLNIKAYLYTVEGVKAAHHFSETKVYGGSDALICDDCGEMMIIVK